MTKITLPIDIDEEPSLDKTVDTLKNKASAHLHEILSQKKRIGSFQSNADIIVKRYHVGDSFFSHAATWHGRSSWWIKIGLAITVISLAAAIGAAFAMPLVFAVVTFVIYAVIIILLEDHYAVSQNHDIRLNDDIVALEKSLAESVDHLSAVEDSLKTVLTSLCKMNMQQATDIEALEAQISKLNEEAQALTNLSKTLILIVFFEKTLLLSISHAGFQK